ncbi:hypothetical protein M569_13243, partial [Genlisea aurea]
IPSPATTQPSNNGLADCFNLLPGDHPGLLLTTIQLRGENYDEWAKAMRAGLRAKKKYGFVDGTITERPPEISVDLWEQVNSMLVAWIINTVEPGLRTTVTITYLVFPLWNDLRERFCVSHGPRLQQLKIDL